MPDYTILTGQAGQLAELFQQGSVSPAEKNASGAKATQNTAWGKAIPYLFGHTLTEGLPLWSGKQTTTPDASNDNVTSMSFAVAVGRRGPRVNTVNVLRIWFDGVLMWDGTDNNVQVPQGGLLDYVMYDGAQDQDKDPTIVDQEGDDNTPAFRGLIYLVFNEFQLVGTSIPQVQVELTTTNVQASNGALVVPFREENPENYAVLRWDTKASRLNAFIGGGNRVDVYNTLHEKFLFTSTLSMPLGGNIDYYNAWASTINSSILATVIGPTNYVARWNPDTGGCEAYLQLPNLATSMFLLGGFKGSQNEFVCVGMQAGDFNIYELRGNQWKIRMVMPSVGFTGPMVATYQQDWTDCGVDNTSFIIGYIFSNNRLRRVIFTTTYVSPEENPPVQVAQCIKRTDDGGYATYTAMKSQEMRDMVVLADNERIFSMIVGKGGKLVWLIVRKSDGHFEVRTFATFYYYHTTQDRNSALTDAEMAAAGGFDVFNQLHAFDIPDGYVNYEAMNLVPAQTTFAYGNYAGGELYVVNVKTGSVNTYHSGPWRRSTLYDDSNYDYGYQGWPSPVYDPVLKCIFYGNQLEGDTPGRAYFSGGRDPTSTYTLEDAFTDLSVLAGYDPGDVQVIGLGNDVIQGMQLNQTVEYVDLIQQLAAAFRVDILETVDGGIRFRRRLDHTPDLIIGPEDLIPVGETIDASFHLANIQRTSTNDLPKTLQLLYIDSDYGFIVGMQQAKRAIYPIPTMQSNTFLSISIPINMSAGQAAYYVGFALFDMWAGQVDIAFLLPPSHFALECGDFVQITLPDDRTYLTKVMDITFNVDKSLSVTVSCINRVRPQPLKQIAEHP